MDGVCLFILVCDGLVLAMERGLEWKRSPRKGGECRRKRVLRNAALRLPSSKPARSSWFLFGKGTRPGRLRGGRINVEPSHRTAGLFGRTLLADRTPASAAGRPTLSFLNRIVTAKNLSLDGTPGCPMAGLWRRRRPRLAGLQGGFDRCRDLASLHDLPFGLPVETVTARQIQMR